MGQTVNLMVKTMIDPLLRDSMDSPFKFPSLINLRAIIWLLGENFRDAWHIEFNLLNYI